MQSASRVSRPTLIVLLGLGLLPVLGRGLPPTAGWGFRHAAYLPNWVSVVLLIAWGLLFLRPIRSAIDHFLFDRFGGWLFGRSHRPVWIVSACATLLFIALRAPTRFLGDGVLVGELVGLGARFRIHDMMDYLLHRLVLQAIGGAGSKEMSFRLYVFGSWLAGFVAVATALSLLRRCRSVPVQARMLAFSLWILAAPTLLYCGYVESYGYLSIAMLGFLWSGVIARRGELPPWVPGLFYGLAGFFHTTAIFAAPSWLFLALRSTGKPEEKRRWAAQVLLPGILLPLAAIGLHLVLGYDSAMFRRDFIESKNQRHLLISFAGPHGFFSLTHLKDLANWLLLVVPVTGWLLVARGRTLIRRVREPAVAFLAIQIVCFVVAFLLLDRKLGAARDWDLLTPQVAGFAFLAALLWEPEVAAAPVSRNLPPIRIAAAWVALLFVAPWLALNATTSGAIRRFDEMRRDFPPFARAYSAEELAKYYYEHGDYERALVLYQECVDTYPGNARTRILLGSTFLVLERYREAGAQYDKAIEIDPNSWLAMDSKARLDLRLGRTAEALELYRKLVPYLGRNADFWSGYGYAAICEKKYSEGRDAFLRGLQIKTDPEALYYAGLSYAYLEDWDPAVSFLTQALHAGSNPSMTASALAASLEARYAAAVARGGGGSQADLRSARDLLAQALEGKPGDARLTAQLAHIERVLSGEERAANILQE